MARNCWTKAVLAALVLALSPAAAPQDMLQFLDLKSEEFSKADMTRSEIEAALAAAEPNGTVNLSGKRLNGLDLSGLDLRRAKLQSARLNAARLVGATGYSEQ